MVRAGLGISALPRPVCPTLSVMGQGVCAQQGISALQGAPSHSPVPAAPSCPSPGWVPVIPACPVLRGSSAKEKAWLLYLVCTAHTQHPSSLPVWIFFMFSGSKPNAEAFLLQDRVGLGISVTLAPHSQTTGTALLAPTALKALNSQSPAAQEASALPVGRGRQQTASCALLGTSAVVRMCWGCRVREENHPPQLHF